MVVGAWQGPWALLCLALAGHPFPAIKSSCKKPNFAWRSTALIVHISQKIQEFQPSCNRPFNLWTVSCVVRGWDRQESQVLARWSAVKLGLPPWLTEAEDMYIRLYWVIQHCVQEKESRFFLEPQSAGGCLAHILLIWVSFESIPLLQWNILQHVMKGQLKTLPIIFFNVCHSQLDRPTSCKEKRVLYGEWKIVNPRRDQNCNTIHQCVKNTNWQKIWPSGFLNTLAVKTV